MPTRQHVLSLTKLCSMAQLTTVLHLLFHLVPGASLTLPPQSHWYFLGATTISVTVDGLDQNAFGTFSHNYATKISNNLNVTIGFSEFLYIFKHVTVESCILVHERSALATLIFTLRVCLSFILSFCHSFCLSATSELNISETRPVSGMVTMDGLYKLAYGLSIGHTPDDVTWPDDVIIIFL